MDFFFLDFIYLFLERGEGREGEKHHVREIYLSDASMPETGELGLQCKHVPQLGIKPATFQFAG